MKKIIAGVLTMLVMMPAFAQHHGHGGKHGYNPHHRHHGHHYHHNRHWHPHYGWVVPAIIGGAVTYAITRPQVIVEPSPVIIESTPSVSVGATVCTEWREIQDSDGKIYRERSCYQR